MRPGLIALIGLCLTAGCMTTYPAGRSITIDTPRFGAAVETAREYCEKMGMDARHVGTDRYGASGMLNRFECVAK